MNLNKYIPLFTLDQIIDIEHHDPQFLSLKKAREKISNKNTLNPEKLFSMLILQNALISFQIAGSGPLRREEFSNKITQDRDILNKLDNNQERRFNFLKSSKYNCRLYNIKNTRIQKFNEHLYPQIQENIHTHDYQSILEKIAKHMKQKLTAKTVTFSIKIYGYGQRIINNNFQTYPMNIAIPLDSRLLTIYKKHFPGHNHTKDQIQSYYQSISEKHQIPPLHLDSLLRLDYREKYM